MGHNYMSGSKVHPSLQNHLSYIIQGRSLTQMVGHIHNIQQMTAFGKIIFFKVYKFD